MLSAGRTNKLRYKKEASLIVPKEQVRQQVYYQFSGPKSDNEERLNNAFDILFEETLRQNGNLTTTNN